MDGRPLSFARRVELIKTALLGTMQYGVQSFKMPNSVIKTMESMLGNFLWRSKLHAWAWDKMCIPKSERGLGIRRINDINTAAVIKLLWRCCTSDSIWAKWMKDHYVQNPNF